MMLWGLLQLVIEFQAHLDMKPSKPLLQGSILSTLEQLAASGLCARTHTQFWVEHALICKD